jgi:hypothetical protein
MLSFGPAPEPRAGGLTKVIQVLLSTPTLVGYTKIAVALESSSSSLSRGTYLCVNSEKDFKSIDVQIPGI